MELYPGIETRHDLAALVRPYRPRLPLPRLVEELNRVYHAVEAPVYDRRHPEITRQLPQVWRQMAAAAADLAPRPVRSVIDLGCGTGFEAVELLRLVPTLERLACIDPSPEMLERCRRRVEPVLPHTLFLRGVDELSGTWDALATNSLLHHLPQPRETVAQVTARLSPGAVWLCGHEPSTRIWLNPETRAVLQAWEQAELCRRLVRIGTYTRRVRRLFGGALEPAEIVAKRAVRAGLFASTPPAKVIGLLVDVHVPHSHAEAVAGRGFDPRALAEVVGSGWRPVWLRTYAYLGEADTTRLRRRWRRRLERLSREHPDDGGHFCAVLARGANPPEAT